MDDLTWLNSRTVFAALASDASAADVRAQLARAVAAGHERCVVFPTHLGLVPEGMTGIAVVGFPTGRHHSLVKAAEARLAVQFGAEEVWLAVDETIADENSLLADVVAVRQSVPPPVRLAVIAATEAGARVAYAAGAEGAVVDKHHREGDTVRVASVEDAVAALESGATRLVAWPR
ncbi:hypothetical protein [Corynebacterium doosanense]|uniref:Deoxyribose-phosphate aldolase n=1 Tax=Corynebacterium doosanense CAU 212 = DSM 45436 TaxID=558173 RepID=A0A097IDL0_9CORY|nr:hypothetical protein [Corynebacterium doosanense]AIT60205.1 deoxyribose-phosphate aldolase [Corynebacterium doosanense CAU 212 = DSM 45436]